MGSFAILNSTFLKNLTARKIRTYVLGIATKFCLQYYANFNALINFHSPWNHQNQCDFQEASIETQILGDTQTHTWTFFHGVPYGMKLFLEELFSEVIFGTHHPKLLDNKFLQHLHLFCMLPLKTVRFYNSELAFIFTFEEESFAEKVVNLQKNLINRIEEGDLQKTFWFTRKNNSYWYKLQKYLSKSNIFGVLNHRNRFFKNLFCH